MDTVATLRNQVAQRSVSSVELTQRSLDAIARIDPGLHAFVAVCPERALAEARAADRAVARGEVLGPFHGVPVAVKDLLETEGVPTSYGTSALRGHVPDRDAVSVERLRRAGAVLVGKTNTPAFGALGETKNTLGDDCRNPWDRSRTAGGSSGGSAAAVAAGLVPLAMGTDSAGSIACPASFCGVVGLKPTRGRIPCWPAPGDSLLLNHVGPIARTAADAALALAAMEGPDVRDPMSLLAAAVPEPPVPARDADRPLAGLRVSYAPGLGGFAVDAEVEAVVRRAAGLLAELDAGVEEASPAIADPLDLYMRIYTTDFRRTLGGLDPVICGELFPETERELVDRPPLSGEDYAGALNDLWRLEAALDEHFSRFDVLVSPATACVAFPVRRPPAAIGGRAVTEGWTSFMPFQVPWNLTGRPTVSVPCGWASGLPVGMLLVGRVGTDADLLGVAAAFERISPFGEGR